MLLEKEKVPIKKDFALLSDPDLPLKHSLVASQLPLIINQRKKEKKKCIKNEFPQLKKKKKKKCTARHSKKSQNPLVQRFCNNTEYHL